MTNISRGRDLSDCWNLVGEAAVRMGMVGLPYQSVFNGDLTISSSQVIRGIFSEMACATSRRSKGTGAPAMEGRPFASAMAAAEQEPCRPSLHPATEICACNRPLERLCNKNHEAFPCRPPRRLRLRFRSGGLVWRTSF